MATLKKIDAGYEWKEAGQNGKQHDWHSLCIIPEVDARKRYTWIDDTTHKAVSYDDAVDALNDLPNVNPISPVTAMLASWKDAHGLVKYLMPMLHKDMVRDLYDLAPETYLPMMSDNAMSRCNLHSTKYNAEKVLRDLCDTVDRMADIIAHAHVIVSPDTTGKHLNWESDANAMEAAYDMVPDAPYFDAWMELRGAVTQHGYRLMWKQMYEVCDKIHEIRKDHYIETGHHIQSKSNGEYTIKGYRVFDTHTFTTYDVACKPNGAVVPREMTYNLVGKNILDIIVSRYLHRNHHHEWFHFYLKPLKETTAETK